MAYQIVRIIPTFCPSTDAATGSRAEALPMAYSSLALAHCLAERWDYQGRLEGGDDCFAVVPYGASAYRNRLHSPRPTPADNDLPF